MGSIPGQVTKIPHAAGQLSPRATATEPVHHNWEAGVPQGKILTTATKTPRTKKIISKIPIAQAVPQSNKVRISGHGTQTLAFGKAIPVIPTCTQG